MSEPVMNQKINGENQTSKTEFDCDVLVAGAGPAGATAAYYIAKSGRSVIVLDKHSFSRDKAGSDFLSPGALRELEKIGITNLPAFIEANILNQASIFLNGKELVSGKFPSLSDMPRYGQVVPKKLLLGSILETAKKAGAKVLEGFQVNGFKVESEGVTVTANKGKGAQSFRTRLLIGADGNNSAIASSLRGAPWPKENQAVVVRAYFENVAGLPNQADIYYANDSFPGYSWVFPVNKSEANVGVGTILETVPSAENSEALLTKIIKNDAGMHSRLENATLKGDVSVSTLNLYDQKLPVFGNRVMLVGETAGLVNPFNGEGIQFALESGRWAAEAAANANANDFSAQTLSAYGKRVDDELGEGFRVSALMLGLVRNRNLNPVWLKALEIMGDRSRKDPQYAILTSGILSGMIFPDQKTTAKIVVGVLQEAALSTGATAFAEMLNNPAKAPQVVFKITETGIEVARYAAQDPLGLLTWGMEAATKMAETAAEVTKQVLKETEKPKEKQ